MQVAVEIRVEPKARANRTTGVGIRRSLSVPDYPPRSTRLDGRIDQGVAREATPSLKIGGQARFTTDDGQEIARARSAERTNKLGQQAGRKRFNADFELDICFDSHTRLAHDPPSFRPALVLFCLKYLIVRRHSVEIKSGHRQSDRRVEPVAVSEGPKIRK
jgi:uncharacterized protein YggU (UPF0235/DUF167 family)